MPESADVSRKLRHLARMHGIAVSHISDRGKTVKAKDDVLIALINALSDSRLKAEPDAKEIDAQIEHLRRKKATQTAPPVLVAWDETLKPFWLWLEAEDGMISLSLRNEHDQNIIWTWEGTGSAPIKRGSFKRIKVDNFQTIPHGYYTLQIRIDGILKSTSFVISAPAKIKKSAEKSWGLFAPAYALGGKKNIGDYGDLRDAAVFTKENGGNFFGTLPLLPGYYEGVQKNISPYSPLSRLYWNEIFLDMDDLPGGAQTEIITNNDENLVNYENAYAEKKPVLQKAAENFFAEGGDKEATYQDFLENSQWLEAYALFRAKDAPFKEQERIKKYHLYVQYACHLQMERMKKLADAGEAADLYNDYPVGVDPQGFDAYEFSSLFLNGFYVGAPPDAFFSRGQNWGFHPFHPRAHEVEHFSYFRATLDHFFQYVRILRLDHIMGFYRIYCIPEGMEATEGSYIYYPFEAFLAILCLEAHRHDGVLIGEDLGTVPKPVRQKMERHNFLRMWIFQFEAKARPEKSFETIQAPMIAGFGTHDMFPLAAYWDNTDINELVRFDLLDDKEAKRMRKQREQNLKSWRELNEPFLYALEEIAKSPAQFVIVNVEDIWQETEPQNIPGTVEQYPNWRKKLRYPQSDWLEAPNAKEAFEILNEYRKSA